MVLVSRFSGGRTSWNFRVAERPTLLVHLLDQPRVFLLRPLCCRSPMVVMEVSPLNLNLLLTLSSVKSSSGPTFMVARTSSAVISAALRVAFASFIIPYRVLSNVCWKAPRWTRPPTTRSYLVCSRKHSRVKRLERSCGDKAGMRNVYRSICLVPQKQEGHGT